MSFTIKNTSKRIETFQQGDQIVLDLTFIDEDDQKPTDWTGVTQIHAALPTKQENGHLIKMLIDVPAIAEVSRYKALPDAAGSLNQKFTILNDDIGSVAFWSDNGDSGSTEPNHGADRSVEITTVVDGDSAQTVATKWAVAINADSKFSSLVDPQNLDEFIVTDLVPGARDDGNAGDSGFTFSIDIQGADFEDGGIEIPENGDMKITVKPDESIDLAVNSKTTLDIIIDFPQPLGRTTFEIEDAYEITSRDYELPAPAA